MATLPTYEEATARPDPWVIIAPWVATADAARCCRVSAHLWDVFAPQVWNEPLQVLQACCDDGQRQTDGQPPLDRPRWARYARWHAALSLARSVVWDLVLALDFRGAPVTFQSRNPHSITVFQSSDEDWLATVYCHLPALKCIVFDGHHSLTDAVMQRATTWVPAATPVVFSVADCRHLSAAKLTGLSDYLRNVVYLDMSGTQRTGSIRTMFQHLPCDALRILKLHHLFLTDDDLAHILPAIGTKVWSLDVRSNRLTDRAIASLSTHCFLPPLPHVREMGPSTGYMTETPVYTPIAGQDQETEAFYESGMPLVLRPDDTDAVLAYFRRHGNFSSASNIGFHDALLSKCTGITHLRMAGNKLTAEGVRALLLATNRLQLLDVGSVQHTGTRPPAMSRPFPQVRPYFQPATAPLLRPIVSQQLQHLRIHHSIVTHVATIPTAPHISRAKLLALTEDAFADAERAAGRQPFLPDDNARIHTLILTDVPRVSGSGHLISALITFLRASAAQDKAITAAAMAALRSSSSRRRTPQILSGLKVLRLEMEPLDRDRLVESTTRSEAGTAADNERRSSVTDSRQSRPGNPFYATDTSVSGDADCDAFTSASMDDFSFFENPQESPSAVDAATTPRPAAVSPRVRAPVLKRDAERPALRSVVDELRSFRQQTRVAWERGQRNEFWTGSLEIVG